jgi:hypothetical protein
VNRALFVTDQDVLDLCLDQLIIEINDRAPWITKNRIDSFCQQCFH